MKKAINSKNAPEAIGPYNQAIESGNMIFVSGQLPVHVDTGMPATIKDQTRQVLENLGHVLIEAGLGYDNVVKTTCFLSDMVNFNEMNEVYASYFQSVPPARATIAVKQLPLNALVEIECIAVKKKLN